MQGINVRPWLDVFVPIAAIGMGIVILLSVTSYVVAAIRAAVEPHVGEEAKRKNDERLEPEEKPKRKHEDFTLGDDGELMESLDPDSLTLDDLIRDYDRSEDE
jgi:hypothetical protein